MKVYVAQEECGDYYCGCGGGHIVGVYSTEEAAKQALGGPATATMAWGRKITEFEVATPVDPRG